MVGHIVKVRFAILILSIGIAASYFYAGISAFRHPDAWMSFLPEFLQGNPLSAGILQAFAAFEIALAVWLVPGLRTIFAAMISVALMIVIILVNPSQLPTIFQNISIIFASLALAVLAR